MAKYYLKQHGVYIDAIWDNDAGVWVATSDDVIGLATEAISWRKLQRKLDVMIPELVELNGVGWAHLPDRR